MFIYTHTPKHTLHNTDRHRADHLPHFAAHAATVYNYYADLLVLLVDMDYFVNHCHTQVTDMLKTQGPSTW